MQLDKSIINQLAKKREVPYEVMFKLSDAQQDPIKKNRYWFEFPSQWSNQLDKDPIIGIRDMYLAKTNRSINFDFTIQLVDLTDPTKIWRQRTYKVRFWLIADNEFDYVTTTFNNRLANKEFTTNDANHVDFSSTSYDFDDVALDFGSLYIYEENDNKVYLRFQKKSHCPSTVTVLDTSNQSHNAYLKMSVLARSSDTINIFGSDEVFPENDGVILIPIWTRYNCYLLSSLAEDDVNNFLGHTRPLSYNPIKYYRLKNKNKRFWIELYETKYHDVPVTLPTDNRDDLFIEAIVCFSSAGML